MPSAKEIIISLQKTIINLQKRLLEVTDQNPITHENLLNETEIMQLHDQIAEYQEQKQKDDIEIIRLSKIAEKALDNRNNLNVVRRSRSPATNRINNKK